MIDWLKGLFCFHEWKHISDIEVFTSQGIWCEELHECKKCGKLRQRSKK